MPQQHQPDNIKEMARILSSALDMAIYDLAAGNSALCLETLQSLHGLLQDIADPEPRS